MVLVEWIYWMVILWLYSILCFYEWDILFICLLIYFPLSSCLKALTNTSEMYQNSWILEWYIYIFLLHPFPSLTISLSSLLVGYESRKLKITFNAKYTISNNISLWNVLTSAKRLISVQEFSWKCSIPFKILVWIEWQACKSLQHLTWKQNEVKEVAEYFFTFFP